MAIHWGIGRHIQYLEPAQIVAAIKFELLAQQPWGIISPTFARVSFSFFLMRFVGQSKPMKRTLWQVIVVQTISNLTTLWDLPSKLKFKLNIYSHCNSILVLVQCQHFASLWDPSVKGRCWGPNIQINIGYAQGGGINHSLRGIIIANQVLAINTFHDLLLTFLPLFILKDLSIKLRVKIILVILMSMSVL